MPVGKRTEREGERKGGGESKPGEGKRESRKEKGGRKKERSE